MINCCNIKFQFETDRKSFYHKFVKCDKSEVTFSAYQFRGTKIVAVRENELTNFRGPIFFSRRFLYIYCCVALKKMSTDRFHK